ncbi:GTP-binding protein gtr2 [Grifola frondosa]|uniref:GTP-binding protein n=1 Tax=Grifola frondosa TaxID=5627 RepID=A0A1C7M5A9_GRIFR|nr:GTP-binding protein gtr2 [Grifola frondosa]
MVFPTPRSSSVASTRLGPVNAFLAFLVAVNDDVATSRVLLKSSPDPASQRDHSSRCRAHEDPPVGYAEVRVSSSFLDRISPLPPYYRSGKTSIQQVLFNNMSPKQTFYLEKSTRVTKHTFDTVIPLEIWDCPGDISLDALDAPLSQFATMIFVIDIQVGFYLSCLSPYLLIRDALLEGCIHPAYRQLVDFILAAYQENPNMNFEVFVHKAETLSEEYKIENFRNIQQRVLDELTYISIEYEQLPINFQLTSIFDHTLHDAFSRVLHKLIDSLPYLEDLLNVFCANSQASKAFLFDVASRLYVATDASPVDPPTHNQCTDYLEMLNSFGPLYKSVTASPMRFHPPPPPTPTPSTPASPASAPSLPHSPLPPSSPLPASPSPSQSETPSMRTPTLAAPPLAPVPRAPPKPLFYPSASASLSPSAGGAGRTLTYHLVTSKLALLALLPTPVFEARRGLVEYNVVFFREGVQEIYEVEEEARRVPG